MTTTKDGLESLRRSALLAGAPAEVRDAVLGAARHQTLSAGDLLLRAGDRGRDLFVVLHGVLDVVGGDGHVLSRLHAGEIVGERAHLNGGHRSASVRAVRDSSVARIPAAVVSRLIVQHPAALRGLATVLADRVATSSRAPVAEVTRTVALLPATAGSHDDLRTLATRLATALGAATVVDAERVDRELGTGTASAPAGHPRAVTRSRWLADIERAHRFVVLVGDGDRRWRASCLRQADLPIGVASGARPGNRLLPPAFGTAPRATIVVTRTGGSPTPGVARTWFDEVPPAAVRHLDVSSAPDLARLARTVAGVSRGVVLGGGGARGFAHLGVLRAFDDAGVDVDAIGGTSIGALAGALFALGHDHSARLRRATDGLLGTRRLIGWTLPLLSISSAKKLTRLLRSDDMFGDVQIEDLPLPFFAVSASFTTGNAVIHDHGPLWLALRASISLPGVMPPVCHDGDVLVDGGVVNNVPVDIMRERLAGEVVAVNLRGRAPGHAIIPFDPGISGWRVLARRLHPRRDAIRLPGPAAMMLRAKELGAKEAHLARLALADLVIEPDVSGVDNLDFRAGAPLVEPAYEHALEILGRWRRPEVPVGAMAN